MLTTGMHLKRAQRGQLPLLAAVTKLLGEVLERAARTVLAAVSEGDALRMNLSILKRFTKFDPVNSIAVRRPG
jgi:hypothetical protein